MALGRKGQAIVVGLMVAVVIFIFLLAMLKPAKDELRAARNSSALNCSSTEITTVNRATCSVLDIGLFYLIGIIVAASISVVTGKASAPHVITAIFVFVVVMVLITPLKDLVISARDSDHLNCDGGDLSVGEHLGCIVIDLWLFYFVTTVIAVAISVAFISKVLPKVTGEE